MSFRDDIIYLSLLLLSIFWGKVVRSFPEINQRKWLSTAFGLTVLFLVSGLHGLHCFVSVAIQIGLILALPWRSLHIWSFLIQFVYLFFFRLSHTFGILPPYPPHTNAVQMILTLKVRATHSLFRGGQIFLFLSC